MSASDFLTALGTGSGLPRALCALAMTLRFTEVRCAAAHMGAALQGIFVGQGPRALPGSAEKLDSGRCGERTERCRWQRKRSERVAAVKILSVRRKAAQKFWAPQQDHRPLQPNVRATKKDRRGAVFFLHISIMIICAFSLRHGAGRTSPAPPPGSSARPGPGRYRTRPSPQG